MRNRKLAEFWQVAIVLMAFSMVLMAALEYNAGFDLKIRNTFYKGAKYLELPAMVLRDTVEGIFIISKEKEAFLEEINLLQRENIALRLQLNKLREQQDEAIAQAYLPSQENSNALRAKIIYRHPGWWWRYMTVDKGGKDGVKRGMPVLSGENVVGRIFLVEDTTSVVELITSPDLRIPVVVDDTRDIGVLSGDGKGKMILHYMPKDITLPSDIQVTTAFAMGNFLPGLLVGTIESLQEDMSVGDFTTYKVKPNVNFSRLRRVTILEVM